MTKHKRNPKKTCKLTKKPYQYECLEDAIAAANHYEEGWFEQYHQIQALKALVYELAVSLYEENPNANITFFIKDFATAYAVD